MEYVLLWSLQQISFGPESNGVRTHDAITHLELIECEWRIRRGDAKDISQTACHRRPDSSILVQRELRRAELTIELGQRVEVDFLVDRRELCLNALSQKESKGSLVNV